MFQLRGLGEDCSKNPNDPVCRAFYGTTPTQTPYQAYKAILATNLIQPQTMAPSVPSAPNPLVEAVTPGTVVVTAGGKPWWMSWWVLGLAAVGGVGLWMYSRPKSSPASTAIAGLFKRRR